MTTNEVFYQLRTASRALVLILAADTGALLGEAQVEALRRAVQDIEYAQVLIWPAMTIGEGTK
jgi:hypothetical protein